MRLRTVLVTAAIAATTFVVGTNWGMHYQDFLATKRQLASAEQRLDRLALNQVRLKATEFANLNGLTYEDALMQAIAMTNAKPCIGCNVWEWNGSSEYYTVPFAFQVSNEHGDGSFLIVPATAFHVDGRPVVYNPALEIYYSNKAGATWRIGADGSVHRRSGDSEWLPETTTPERIAAWRHSAASAVFSRLSSR